MVKKVKNPKTVFAKTATCIYIGDVTRNEQVRIGKHRNTCNDSKLTRCLRENTLHLFSSRILCMTHSFDKQRILEGVILKNGNPV